MAAWKSGALHSSCYAKFRPLPVPLLPPQMLRPLENVQGRRSPALAHSPEHGNLLVSLSCRKGLPDPPFHLLNLTPFLTGHGQNSNYTHNFMEFGKYVFNLPYITIQEMMRQKGMLYFMYDTHPIFGPNFRKKKFHFNFLINLFIFRYSFFVL